MTVDASAIRHLPVAALDAHPDNPRLISRDELVEQIASRLATDGFDVAHAVLVRPAGDARFQIISGHTRIAAARKAGLESVPAWIREMSDDDAFMALVTCNAQAELSPLERGMHALKATDKGKHNGASVAAYAQRIGRSRSTVAHEAEAAEVAVEVFRDRKIPQEILERPNHLSELHAAPRWLWRALAARLLQDGMTVEQVRRLVAGTKGLPIPLGCLDRDGIATDVARGIAGAREINQMNDMLRRYFDLVKEVDGIAIAEAAFEDGPLDIEGFPDKRPRDYASLDRLLRPLIRALEDKKAATESKRREAAETAATLKHNISLDQWMKLSKEQRDAVLDFEHLTPHGQFNKQSGDAIEWAQFSWNPVTGCLHDCPYCYARDIAVSGEMAKAYPNGFAPTLRPSSLLVPRHQKVPKEAVADARFKNVFTCSMADLFGRWVPAEWIAAVLDAARGCPQWNFLFLTKFPQRMAEFDLPENTWVGTTVDLQARVANAEKAFARIKSPVKWLSIEPMLEPLRFDRLDLFDWIVIGGSSRSTRTPEWHPPFTWIADLVAQARAANVRVYFKTNLLDRSTPRILELPMDLPVRADPSAAPKVFHYLGAQRKNQSE